MLGAPATRTTSQHLPVSEKGISMMHSSTRPLFAAIAAFILMLGLFAAPRPARADDTTSTLLGAAIGVAGTLIYENVLHRQQSASTVVGYTSNGCAVYADGHTGCATTTNGLPPTVSCVGQTCTNGTPASYGRYGRNGTYGYGRYGGGYGNYSTYGTNAGTVATGTQRRYAQGRWASTNRPY